MGPACSASFICRPWHAGPEWRNGRHGGGRQNRDVTVPKKEEDRSAWKVIVPRGIRTVYPRPTDVCCSFDSHDSPSGVCIDIYTVGRKRLWMLSSTDYPASGSDEALVAQGVCVNCHGKDQLNISS